jgi:hypothetical protein
MKKLTLISFSFVLFACGEPTTIRPTYVKDKSTGICFAEYGMANGYAFTYVPCELIPKGKLK